MKAEERKAFLERVVADDRIREDLLDAALIEERKGEPTRPLEEVLGAPSGSSAGCQVTSRNGSRGHYTASRTIPGPAAPASSSTVPDGDSGWGSTVSSTSLRSCRAW
jgi:hypothetical protein